MTSVGLVLLLLLYSWRGRAIDGPDQEITTRDVTEQFKIGPEHTLSPSSELDSCIDSCTFTEEEENISKESENSYRHTQLAKSDPKLNFFANVYDGLSSGLSTVYLSANSAKKHLYSKVSDVTSDFAEKVRKILKEEFWNLIVDGLSDVFNTATAPGIVQFGVYSGFIQRSTIPFSCKTVSHELVKIVGKDCECSIEISGKWRMENGEEFECYLNPL